MKACTKCFVSRTWIANASPLEGRSGTCDFGHGTQEETWPTSAWFDSLSQVLEVYQLSRARSSGNPISALIQRDWGIFSFHDEATIRRFITSSIGESDERLAEEANVELLSVDNDDGSAALSDWIRFSEEIRSRNRYFPQTVPDREVLERVLMDHVRVLDVKTELFRARSVESGIRPSPQNMGAPPARKAIGGRANPPGIPYLYLAFSEATCIYESRAGKHSRLAIGHFKLNRELRVLDLASIKPPDFFDVEDISITEQQVRRISSHRYLAALGEELRKPIRVSDQVTDYIPTQYLCELAKSLGLDGLLYSSSQHDDGRNVVFFDIGAATCNDNIKVVEVVDIEAEWETIETDNFALP